jgi:predicted MFS family arabinose efflux permease
VLFATRELGMSPGLLGLAQMLGGVGMLSGSMMMGPLSRRFGSGATILMGLCSTALGFALLPAISPELLGSRAATFAAYAAVMFFFDCGAQLFFIPYISLRQRVTPDAFLGRMTSTMRFLTVATAPLGAMAAGALAERFSVRAALGCIAVGALVLTLATVFLTGLRHAKD